MPNSVLIVDDSLTVRMDLADAFTAAGFRPVPCRDLAEARRALEQQKFALAVLDVLLPDGDGIDFLAGIRADPVTAEMPVLMLSSEAEVEDRIRGLSVGADEYVGKPYDTSHVIARGRELVGGWNAASDVPRATVLVVDDSLTYREELRRGLEEAGYTVMCAASGEEGIRVAGGIRPSAVIVDGVMPGIDGATVIRGLRLDAALRGTPCLLLTGSEDLGAELRALDAGADAFVRKSEDLQLILARLGALLRSTHGDRGSTETLQGPKRILAVDDSKTYLQALASTLRGDGYDVILAVSGEAALEMLAVQSVDCILLDLLMPGMGGKETCRRIKSMPSVREIPLVILTAVEEREAMIEGLGTGADDFISKASDFEVLKARVRAQLRRKQFEDEHRTIRESLLRSEIEASEARAARAIAEAKAALVEELEHKNRELEAFSYSVSHDLRAPLRSIDGFSHALLEDQNARLDDTGRRHLQRIRAAAQRMGELIDDMLSLARVGRAELHRDRADLSAIARVVVDELQRNDPERRVEVVVADDCVTRADRSLLRMLLDNLIGNAWKFTGQTPQARIEFGSTTRGNETLYFVRDNGAGFDMNYASRLFTPFQRLHSEREFPGTGIGLATVHRIVVRHGGRVWAEAMVGKGATIWFTLGVARDGA